MPAPKGHKRYGGRKKGTPNKSTLNAQEKADKLGIDPFEILLMFAKGDWHGLGYEKATETFVGQYGQKIEVPIIPAQMRLKAASDASAYLLPKRKPVDAEGKADPIEQKLKLEYVTSWGGLAEPSDPGDDQ